MNAANDCQQYQQIPPRIEASASYVGSELNITYFRFEVGAPTVLPPDYTLEMTDTDLLRAAEQSGSFAFLEDPGEDIYNDLAKKPQEAWWLAKWICETGN